MSIFLNYHANIFFVKYFMPDLNFTKMRLELIKVRLIKVVWI